MVIEITEGLMSTSNVTHHSAVIYEAKTKLILLTGDLFDH
jgi:hypothetical protein